MLDNENEFVRDGLEDLQRDEVTDHSVDRRKISGGLEGQLLDSLLVNIGVNGLGKRDEFCGILCVSWSQRPLVLSLKLREGLESHREGGTTDSFGDVSDEELWGRRGIFEWFLCDH